MDRPLLLKGQLVRGYPAFPRQDGRELVTGIVLRDMMTNMVEVVAIEAVREVTILYPPEVLAPTTVPASRLRMWVSQLTVTGLGVLAVEAILWTLR